MSELFKIFIFVKEYYTIKHADLSFWLLHNAGEIFETQLSL